MADCFMIRFPLNGKTCYANVYAYNGLPRKFYVHLVNPLLCPGLPSHIELIEKDGHLNITEGVSQAAGKDIMEEIRKYLAK